MIEAPDQDPAQAEPTQQVAAARPTAEQLRPPEEAEVQELGRVLRSLADERTSAETLKGLHEGRPFAFARMTVLMGDARSLMAEVHARELRTQIAANTRLSREVRLRLEAGIQLMETCAPRRFVTRDGEAAYRRSLALVRKYRAQLEPYVFERSPWRRLPTRPTAPPDAGEGRR